MPKTKSKSSSIDDAIRKASAESAGREPVWKGPSGIGPQGGITNSLLARYLACKERFRVLTVVGLRPHDRFNPRMEFGNMWHACEEELAAGLKHCEKLKSCIDDMSRRYPMNRDDITLWTDKCVALFPRYVEHWSRHPDVLARKPLLQEYVFDVPYPLPSGRSVRLRGKWDAVDLIDDGIWIQENKTKSQIDRAKLERQLGFDLQTMLYVIALETWRDQVHVKHDIGPKNKLLGIRYNVVRRAAHKSAESMLKKVDEDCRNGRAGEWFDRWEVRVTEYDVKRFRRQCLDPVLENLCDDYEWWATCHKIRADVFNMENRTGLFPLHQGRHFRFPNGIYNPLIEGGEGEVDTYLNTGSEAGLRRVEDLFPELK